MTTRYMMCVCVYFSTEIKELLLLLHFDGVFMLQFPVCASDLKEEDAELIRWH